MEDSGWYMPDYTQASYFSFGHQAGCDFVSDSDRNHCSSPKAAHEPYFCDLSADDSRRCVDRNTAIGYCRQAGGLWGTCRAMVAYSNGDCKTGSPSAQGAQIGYAHGGASACLPDGKENVEVGGTLAGVVGKSGDEENCYETSCTGNPGSYVLNVCANGDCGACPPGGDLSLKSLTTTTGVVFNTGRLEPARVPRRCSWRIRLQR